MWLKKKHKETTTMMMMMTTASRKALHKSKKNQVERAASPARSGAAESPVSHLSSAAWLV